MGLSPVKSARSARSRRVATVVVLGMVGPLAWSAPAWAATTRHVSTTGSDVGDCSINPCKTIGYGVGQSVSGDTVDIAAGTYVEHVTVDKSIAIRGAGAGSTFIDGSHSDTVIKIGSSSASLAVTISKLTIQHGEPISSDPNLSAGGLLSMPGHGMTNRVVLDSDDVSANYTYAAYSGGIGNAAGSRMTISRSTVSGNIGGIYNSGTLTVTGTTIEGNSLGQPGGGIANAGTLRVIASTIWGNTALGARGYCITFLICFPGGNGMGGGLYNKAGTAELVNSTVSGNSAKGGSGCIQLVGCRGAGSGLGGGIWGGSVTAINSTIAGNSAFTGWGVPQGSGYGGGIDMSGPDRLTNTILAGNSAAHAPDCNGTVTSGGHNLVSNTSSCSGFTGAGDLVDVNPLLGPLQDNSGPTLTMALGAGSPAIAAGDNSVCAAPRVKAVDQRGLPRVDDPQCDIGAYEVQP